MNWQEEPPICESEVRVWWCPRSQKHLVRLLDAPLWHSMHWVDEKSRPCPGGDCEHCKLNLRVHWQAYFPAMLWARNLKTGDCQWNPIVLMLSATAGKRLAGEDCQDALVRLSRGAAVNSIVTLELEPYEERPQLPDAKAFDVRPILHRLWGVRERPIETGENPHTIKIRRQA